MRDVIDTPKTIDVGPDVQSYLVTDLIFGLSYDFTVLYSSNSTPYQEVR